MSGKEMKAISAIFTNISLLVVVLQRFLCESCIIFFKMPRGEYRWSKKRKFYGNIPNRSTINVCESGNSEENSFNVNIDENEVSNVNASSSKLEDIFVSYESENLRDLSGYRRVSTAIINSILENCVF
jgi:hypothetical protein